MTIKLNQDLFSNIVKKLMSTCYSLTEFQIKNKCQGNHNSKYCTKNCYNYPNRYVQCKGDLASSTCETCILNNLYFKDLDFSVPCIKNRNEYFKKLGVDFGKNSS